jgi:hypothetical protein
MKRSRLKGLITTARVRGCFGLYPVTHWPTAKVIQVKQRKEVQDGIERVKERV